MFIEQRTDPREALRLPLRLADGTAAITRDVSPSGMYFEIPGDYTLQGPLLFEMELADARMKFTAQGRIVRVDRTPGHTGVAIRLVAPRLLPLP